jgi:hypothetical protein
MSAVNRIPSHPENDMLKPTRILRTHGALRLVAAALGGCAIQPPQPWERGNLAKPEMTMGADPLDQRFVQHIYGSKENASGGYGVGGGGCGCN